MDTHRSDAATTVRLETVYTYVPALQLWLPEHMDEFCEGRYPLHWERLAGHAEYSNYRRFETSARIK
jgi:hypothetical protein